MTRPSPGRSRTVRAASSTGAADSSSTAPAGAAGSSGSTAGARSTAAAEPGWKRSGRPAHPVRATAGRWRYSTGTSRWPRGVYMWDADLDAWEQVAPLPYVHGRLVRRAASGRATSVTYRISAEPAGAVVVVDRDQVKSGEWADLLGVVLPADDRIGKAATTALRAVATQAPVVDLTPRWADDWSAFLAPPADVGPAGYGETAGTEDDARSAWRVLVAVMAGSPRLALAVGAAVSGLYFATMDEEDVGFILYLCGDAQKGKSTALRLGAGIYGKPRSIKKQMNFSSPGITAYLGGLGDYPAFIDELGTVPMSAAQLESFALTLGNGGERNTSTRTGDSRTSAEWRSVAVMTGNPSINGQATNEAVPGRVVEVPTPITASSEDAKTVGELLTRTNGGCYGWPLQWMLRDPRVEEFRTLVDQAREELPVPAGGGVPLTISRHLALCVAGVTRLEEVTGGQGARDAALVAAREVLGRNVAELAERGADAGERLFDAVMQAYRSRPGAFPSVEHYEALAGGYTRDGLRLAANVEGFAFDGTVAVLTSKLPEIAAENRLDDIQTALRKLRESGRLITTPSCNLRYEKRILDVKTKLYAFRLDDDRDDQGQDDGAVPAPAAPVPPVLPEPAPAPAELGFELPLEVPEPRSAVTAPEPAVDDLERAMGLLARELGAVPLVPVQGQELPAELAGTLPAGSVPAPDVQAPAELGFEQPLEVPVAVPQQDGPAPAGADVPAELGDNLSAFARVFADVGETVADDELPDVLKAFQWALAAPSGGKLGRPLFWSHSAGDTGRRLFEMIQGRGARVEKVTATDRGEYGKDYGPQHLPTEWVRTPTASENGRRFLVGFDVNAQYLGAAGSICLGNGAPLRYRRAGNLDVEKNLAGMFRLTVKDDAAAVVGGVAGLPGLVEPGEGWYSQPVAEYLYKAGAVAEIYEKYEWPDSRQWLTSWVRCVREARYRLLEQSGKRPYDLALVALKSMYASFLGGWLASGDYNHSHLYRPDWRDAVHGAARANQHRHVMKVWEASGNTMSPVMVYRDSMYFAVDSLDELPPGLELGGVGKVRTGQPGKWKRHRAVQLDTVRSALESGSASVTNDAIIAEVRNGNGADDA